MKGLRRRRLLLGGCAVAGGGIGAAGAGCSVRTPPTTVPMNILRPAGACNGAAAPVLLVMLPGVRSEPQEFVDEGFVAAVRQRDIAADIQIVDAHLGYYENRSILQRLRDDVVLPARAAGHRSIWLVGISLGGLGALGYAARQAAGGVGGGREPGAAVVGRRGPDAAANGGRTNSAAAADADDAVDGVVALAPYLGRREVLREIADAGGPLAWRRAPRASGGGGDDLERDLWSWLAGPAADPLNKPPVYLGYGRDDRFAEGHRLLAGVLPAGRSTTVAGGHDWPPWLALWSQWLDRGLLPTQCAAAPR